MSVVVSRKHPLPRSPFALGRALILGAGNQTLEQVARALSDSEAALSVSCQDWPGALQHLLAGAFDLLLIDFRSRPEDGLLALAKVRENPHLDDVVCIGLVEDPSRAVAARALELGIDDLLREPLDPGFVRHRLRHSLERRRLNNEAISYWVGSVADDAGDHAHSVLEALPEPIIVLGPDSAIEIANEAAARLFGNSQGDMIGAPIGALLSPAVEIEGAGPISAQSLAGVRRSTIFVTRGPSSASRPVQVAATCYERFGRSMCALVLHELGWSNSPPRHGATQGPRANGELWSEVAAQALRRLDEARRHVETMKDQVFGPIGTAIYHSFLLDALSSLDQARHLLDQQGHLPPDRRLRMREAVPLAEMAAKALNACRGGADIRHVACTIEISPPDLELRLPEERVVELLTSTIEFAILATDAGDTLTLRTQMTSDQRLLVMVDAGETAISTSHLAGACAEPSGPAAGSDALTSAWHRARSAAGAMGGKLELSLDHPRGGFMVMAFLPQRRDGDPE